MAKRSRVVETSRVVAYIRVSTDKQGEKGISLEAQEAKCRAYAALHDLELVAVLSEVESAKSLRRPVLEQALGMLGKTADALLVVKLDRLTRSVRDLGHLVETHFGDGKAALLSVAEQVDTRSAAGRLVLNIMATISQWEREAIGERTVAVLDHKRLRGEKLGGHAPYGYAVAEYPHPSKPAPAILRRLVPCETEQVVVRLARKLASTGMSQRRIAAELFLRGLTSRASTPFSQTQVRHMVAQEVAA